MQLRNGHSFGVAIALALALHVSACGGSSDKGPSDFLGPCQNDSDCVSQFCLESPNVCTKECTKRADCPLASSWACVDGPSAQGKRCDCPRLGTTAGCDVDCDGVDEDPVGAWHHAVQSTLVVPSTPAQATQYAFDLDDNGVPDNNFRFTVSFFATIITDTTGSEAVIATLNQDAVNAGTILFLHSFHGESTSDDSCASWKTYLARPVSQPDFSGAGAFDVDTTVPESKPLYGSLVAGTFKGQFGEMPIRLKMGPSSNSTVTLPLRGVRLEATLGPSGCMMGRLGGGIPIEVAKEKLVPALTSEINRVLSQEPNTAHAQRLLMLFDTNHDQAVSVDEVRANPLFSLGPDVDLVRADGSPGEDGVKDSISIGLGFGCKGAVYSAPGE